MADHQSCCLRCGQWQVVFGFMPIVFLTSDPNGIGGIQRYIRDLLDTAEDIGVHVLPVIRERSKTSFGFMAKALFMPMRVKPREIICGHINFSAVGWVLSWLGYQYSVLTYGIEVWHLSAIQRIFLRRAKKIATISRYSRDSIVKQCPQLKDRVFLLPPKVNEDIFTISAPQKNFVSSLNIPGRKIILTITRMDERERYKGYDRLIQILPAVIKAVPEAHYVLAGGDGGDVERINTAVQKAGLKDRVSILTNVPQADLPDLYRSAHVFVMPSTGEGFGIVFLEAIACGKPAIGGSIDGSRDPLGDGEFGIIVDPEDEKSLTKEIVNCLTGNLPGNLQDPAALRQRMLKVFGKEAFRQRLADFIQEPSLAGHTNRV